MSTWLLSAIDAAERVCDRVGLGGTFTTDDIWAELERRGVEPLENPKQMSVVINGMRRMKIIRSAGMTKTERPERNSGYCTIWKVVLA